MPYSIQVKLLPAETSMRDHQTIIDAARSFLRRPDQTLSPELTELASEFVELTALVDQRLRRCEDFLRRGLLGEAIHHADLAPPILEVVGLINFQERNQFDEILGMYGLPIAPRLDVLRARALNQAYADHLQIADLLREHRRLNVARAPVDERLALLRQLAAADPTNAIWNDDIQLLEQPALDELKKRAQTAWFSSDETEISTILGQFQAGNWSSAEVPALAQQLQQQLYQIHHDRARQNLPALSKELKRAMHARDLAATQAALQRLYQELQTANVPAEDPLQAQAAQAATWLQGEYNRQQVQAVFDQEVQAFQAKLASARPSLDDVEAGYERLERYGMPIPDPIKKAVKRLRQKARDEEAAREARLSRAVNNTLLAIVAPIALGVLVIMAIMIYRIFRA